MKKNRQNFFKNVAARAIKWASQQAGAENWSWLYGQDDDTGLQVNAETAMQLAAVSSAVRLLAETVGTLPLFIYRRESNGNKVRETNTDVSHVIHNRPNKWQTPFEFKTMLTAHACLRGNGYARIISSPGRGVDQLIPLNPDRVTPFWRRDGTRAYRYQPLTGPEEIILQSEMFHIMFFSLDGLVGIDPISYHRRTLGMTIGAEKYGARFYKNDATPPMALVFPGKMKDTARQNVKESWNAEHQSVNRSHKAAILEDGMDVKMLNLTPENAQFLATRKYQVADIARIFRVQPHLIGDLENATFSNIQEQGLEFVNYTMMPWFVKWEQAISRDLLDEDQQRTMFAEFLVDALLRGDIGARYSAYATGRQWGWLNVNQIRQFENMNGIGDQGDQYLIPLNMIPATDMREMKPEEITAIRALAMKSMLETLDAQPQKLKD